MASDGGLGEVLADLLAVSHDLHPDDLAVAVSFHAARLGARDTVVFLADYQQRLLVALPPGRAGVDELSDRLEIDGTVPGRVYRRCTAHQVEVSGGQGGVRLWLPLVDGTERIGVLGATFDPGGIPADFGRFADLVAQLVTSKTVYGDTLLCVRRTRNLDLAAEMRWSMLPPLTFTSSRVEISAVLEPAYEIAGDTFDYAVNGDHAHLALIDAMGHSVEASAMATLAVAAYRCARRDGLGLAATFELVDATFAKFYTEGQFATAQLADLDLVTGRMELITGGHPPPLLLRGTHVVGQVAGPNNLPVGLGQPPPGPIEIGLEPGDRVVFYTDGVVEARSPAGEEFGLVRFGDLLARAASAGLLPAEMLRRLVHAVLDHETGRLRDDATIVLLGWPGPGASDENVVAGVDQRYRLPRKGGPMGGGMDEAKGRIEEAVGALTDDDTLKAEGKIDKLAGSVKDVVDKVAEKVKGEVKGE